jgi:hypothetical protein
MIFDWIEVRKLPWRPRYAAVSVAARAYLDGVSKGLACQTFDVAKAIWPEGRDASFKRDMDTLCHALTRVAPYAGAYATHDGPTKTRYGRIWKAWRWHGQGGIEL